MKRWDSGNMWLLQHKDNVHTLTHHHTLIHMPLASLHSAGMSNERAGRQIFVVPSCVLLEGRSVQVCAFVCVWLNICVCVCVWSERARAKEGEIEHLMVIYITTNLEQSDSTSPSRTRRWRGRTARSTYWWNSIKGTLITSAEESRSTHTQTHGGHKSPDSC